MMMWSWGHVGTLGTGGSALVMMLLFLPTFVALLRRHPNSLAIFLLNLLLGWTGIGWIVALVWSATAVDKPQQPH